MGPSDVIVKLLVLGLPALALLGQVVFAWWLHRTARRGVDADGSLSSRERVGSPR